MNNVIRKIGRVDWVASGRVSQLCTEAVRLPRDGEHR